MTHRIAVIPGDGAGPAVESVRREGRRDLGGTATTPEVAAATAAKASE